MTPNHSRKWLHIALAGWSLASASVHATTLMGRPIELEPGQAEILWATACFTYPQSIQAARPFPDRPIIFAEVLCSPHADYQGQPVALAVSCTKEGEDPQWQCRKAVPMIDLKVQDRVVRIRYAFTSAAEVAAIIKFLMTRPSIRNLAVDPAWITSDVNIHGSGHGPGPDSGDRILVSASNRQITLTREQRQGATSFRATDIGMCDGDVCFALGVERPAK